jgi:hypothetical protein
MHRCFCPLPEYIPVTLILWLSTGGRTHRKERDVCATRDEARSALRSAVEQLTSALGPDHTATRAARQVAVFIDKGQ